MRFYDALQLSPEGIKQQIRQSETPREKQRFRLALLTRSVLIVFLAIALIAPVGPLFGPENSCMAVALFCILLGIRFVDFGYCAEDALIYLAISFSLLLFMPPLAALAGPVLGGLIHFIAIFLILAITSDRPEMGNGGLYSFAYILLVGNPVSGELLWKRALLTLIGYLLCALVYLRNHRNKNAGIRFRQLFAQFHLSVKKCRWQFQMALGVSLLLALCSAFQVERVMWAGFACASMLGCYSGDLTKGVQERFWQRLVGVTAGSALFALVFRLVPVSLHGLFGPLGGLCLGFCTDYRYKTAWNCFGALMLATGFYGLQYSLLLRILNNFLGAAFGFAFSILYQKLINRHFTLVTE